MRFADELDDAAEAAEPETPPLAPAKVDPLTYVFGAPGELKGDMARMGTSPRRVLLASLGVLAIALAADLFRITSTILRIAPSNVQEAARRARLDTYYPIGDFKRYIDDEYRFEVRYPERWLGDQAIYVSRMQGRSGAYDADALLKSRKQKGPAALAGFGPAGNTLAGNTAGGGKFENLSVFRSPVTPGLKLRNLGSPTEFAQRLLDTAVAPPESGKKTTLLAASERADGAYAFEYCLQLPERRDGSPGRVLHNLAVAAVRDGNELFTLTVLCGEEDWLDREPVFCQVAKSFRVYA